MCGETLVPNLSRISNSFVIVGFVLSFSNHNKKHRKYVAHGPDRELYLALFLACHHTDLESHLDSLPILPNQSPWNQKIIHYSFYMCGNTELINWINIFLKFILRYLLCCFLPLLNSALIMPSLKLYPGSDLIMLQCHLVTELLNFSLILLCW